MPPIKRQKLIRRLEKLGFTGPYSGGKHPFMMKGVLRLTIPNPHKSDISGPLLKRILEQGNISDSDWESTK